MVKKNKIQEPVKEPVTASTPTKQFRFKELPRPKKLDNIPKRGK